MLEFIQTILGIIVKALPAAFNRRRETRLNALGADLFIFYIQVNEALICAEVIMAELEEFVDRMTRHAHVGDNYAIRAGSRLSRPVQLQCENLSRIAITARKLSLQLQVVDGEAYAKIIVLLSSKAQSLSMVIATMREGTLPIPLELADDLQELVDSALDTYPLPNFILDQKAYLDITSDSIRLTPEWDTDIYRQVKNYLEKKAPRQQITQIRAALDDIRSALEKNFSLNEILLAIGNDRSKHEGL